MTLVKLLAFVVLIVLVANLTECGDSQQQSLAQQIDDYRKHCVEVSDVSVESAIKVHTGEAIDSPDLSTKLYVQCFFQKMQFMDENGVMLKDAVVEFFSKVQDKAKAKAMVNNCDIRREDPLDTAYDVLVCYQRNKSG